MKPCNSKHKAFALTKTGAAALITAALLTAILLFTACKQVTGGGGGGGSVPTVNITVTGDTNINLPAEPIAVTAGGTWQKERSGIESKVSPKPGFVIDSWHLGTDESAPELQDTDIFSKDTTVFVASRPDLPDISSIQGGSEQVNITLALTDNSAGSILGQNPVRINKGTAWNSVFQTYANAALKVNYGFRCNRWKKDGTLLNNTFTFDSDTTIFADMEDLRINITVTGDANVNVTDSTPLVVLSGKKWKDIKALAADKVQVSDPENIAVTAWKLNNASGTTLSDEDEFKKSDGQNRTVFAETGDRRIQLTVTYGEGTGTPTTTAGTIEIYDGDRWNQIEERAAALISDPEGYSIHWYFNNAAGEGIGYFYKFEASDGNARTVYAKKIDRRIRITVTYGEGPGTPTTTVGNITVLDGEKSWFEIQAQAEALVGVSQDYDIREWRWNDANGELINDLYTFLTSDGNARTVYAKKFDKRITLTVTYGRITGGTTTLGTVTARHGEIWAAVSARIKKNNPLIKNTKAEWHWKGKGGQPISDLYKFDVDNVPSHTVYALIRPKKIASYYNKLSYLVPIGSDGSYNRDYDMKNIEEVTDGTVGGYSYGSTHNNAHTVSLTAYRIGETEVTQELYELVMGNNPSHHGSDSKRPVEKVSWYDAVAFCNELTRCAIGLGENECVYTHGGSTYTVEDAQAHRVPEMDMTKKGFRLPTQAEWEWAAQGGSARQPWAGTNAETELSTYAWYSGNGNDKTHQVGQKTANRFGLFDMSGNVAEWCWDLFEYITPAGGQDPVGPSLDSLMIWPPKRTICGGYYVSDAAGCRCAYRMCIEPKERKDYIGFRVVCRP